MPFLIQGGAKRVYTAFKLSHYVTGQTKAGAIEYDIRRTNFFGIASDCEFHIDVWRKSSQNPHNPYTQGNMAAGNLFMLFGRPPLLPF